MILTYMVVIIIISIVIPRQYVSHFFFCTILVVLLAYHLMEERSNETTIINQTNMLKKRIQQIMDSGYVKNNENIPLRRISKFRYIFLETELVNMLAELLKYESMYKDVVISVIYYSEAFMRQIFRMLGGRVRDEKLARTLGENIINQLYSLCYDTSRYEKKNIKRIQEQFTEFIWSTYKRGVDALGANFDPETPSPIDMMHSNNYDFYVF